MIEYHYTEDIMTQDKIKLRELKEQDLPEIKGLLYETWIEPDFGDNEKVADKMSMIFLYELLIRHTYSKVAIYEERVIGVILGRSDNTYKLRYNLKYLIKTVFHASSLFLTKDGRKAIKEGNKEGEADKQLYDKVKDHTNGELVLFAMDKNMKGMGIGKKLLNDFYSYMKKENVDTFYLFTDSKCDYSFYDYNGFEKKDEKEVVFNNQRERYFVYTKNVE
ncbi:acetyltransferase, GNAT family [Anaerofustis stercorihominis DSM 17244]|uniref:Acetyltransferase, GNAT family n=2 Tax=Anaerofustis stercorihominis TaxID=214853 RepID=B1C610_9FIRM|nr:acetyltransferase, GNAT family [Anaerofustis stercorihominis DSM 17244]